MSTAIFADSPSFRISPVMSQSFAGSSRPAAGIGLLLLTMVCLSGCAPVRHYGEAAAAARREQNDLQARATMAATCDIAVASYLRELSPRERQGVALICPDPAAAAGLPELLVAPDRPGWGAF